MPDMRAQAASLTSRRLHRDIHASAGHLVTTLFGSRALIPHAFRLSNSRCAISILSRLAIAQVPSACTGSRSDRPSGVSS